MLSHNSRCKYFECSVISFLKFFCYEFRDHAEWFSHVMVEPVILYFLENLSTSVATKNIARPSVLQQNVGTNHTLFLWNLILWKIYMQLYMRKKCHKLSPSPLELTLWIWFGTLEIKTQINIKRKYMLLGSNFKNRILKEFLAKVCQLKNIFFAVK